MSAGFERRYRTRFGISVAEWRVVAHLSQQPSVSVREIHERVGMDKPKVSRAATWLEANGYISKKAHPSDKRLVELALTAKGEDLIALMTPIAAAYQRDLDAALGGEAAAFRKQMSRLAGALEQSSGRAR